MRILVPTLACLLLCHDVSAGFFGWGWGLDGYRDARANYHEMMTNCEQDGGECMDVDFSTGVIGRGSRNIRNNAGGENEGAAPRGRPSRGGSGHRGQRGTPRAARRQAPAAEGQTPMNPQEILDYLYSECRSWELDFGCHRKGNICCY